MTLTLFAVPTEAGTDLSRGVQVLAERLGYSMTVAEPVSQWTLMEAVATGDVVVFDATIEDEQRHIYHARHPVLGARPRYLWAPLRMGQTRTAGRTGLRRLETYVVLKGEA